MLVPDLETKPSIREGKNLLLGEDSYQMHLVAQSGALLVSQVPVFLLETSRQRKLTKDIGPRSDV